MVQTLSKRYREAGVGLYRTQQDWDQTARSYLGATRLDHEVGETGHFMLSGYMKR